MSIQSMMGHGLSIRPLDVITRVALIIIFHENFEKLKFTLNIGNICMYKQNSISEPEH
jgi:hypothetical protein